MLFNSQFFLGIPARIVEIRLYSIKQTMLNSIVLVLHLRMWICFEVLFCWVKFIKVVTNFSTMIIVYYCISHLGIIILLSDTVSMTTKFVTNAHERWFFFLLVCIFNSNSEFGVNNNALKLCLMKKLLF